MKNFETIKNQADRFLEYVFSELEKNKIKLDDHWHIDHLCYRTSTQDNYLKIKDEFSHFSHLLIESEVNGRMISTFKLPEPLVYNDWEIDLIEVPAPKIGKNVVEGFEHFEVVSDLTFDELKKRYPQCNFDESGLNKKLNQELEIPFNGFAIKFHHMSLESVINIEAHQELNSSLQESKILDLLKPFSPLIAGTFPLNLTHQSSDIDLLVSSENLNSIKNVLLENFKHFLNFKCEETLYKGEPTLLVSFTFNQFHFEIFAQKIPTVQQTGYKHFLIEERILKLGKEKLFQKIKEYRLEGIKTEPAFARVLNLTGDPYDQLLELQTVSHSRLKSLILKSI